MQKERPVEFLTPSVNGPRRNDKKNTVKLARKNARVEKELRWL